MPVVVTSAARARDLPKPPVLLLGCGESVAHQEIGQQDLLTTAARQSGGKAFGMAGVTHADIDLCMIYDSFTITLLVELESIGFFERGEAGAAALAGELGLGGRLPCNTHGGLLSFGHSGAAGGMFHAVEAVRQLRGEAQARQVSDARLAFVHGDGGILSAHCSLVMGAR